MTARSSSTHPDHEIPALIRVSPGKARETILDVLRRAGMHQGDAAREFGCAHTTLRRWISKLALEGEIEEMEARAREEGWHHGRLGGRPKGATVAAGAAPRGSKTG